MVGFIASETAVFEEITKNPCINTIIMLSVSRVPYPHIYISLANFLYLPVGIEQDSIVMSPVLDVIKKQLRA